MNNRTKGDIRVVGNVAGTHVIEDLGRDVPYRSLVIIPEAEALMSKDLWRGISQKFLIQLNSAPYPSSSASPMLPDHEKARLETYCLELESHVTRLQNENAALKKQLESSASAHSAKLDEILMALQAGIKVVPGVYPAASQESRPQAVNHAVDGSAPTFLPGAIVPKDVDTRINIEGEQSTSGAVSEAADRLRRLRRKGSGRE